MNNWTNKKNWLVSVDVYCGKTNRKLHSYAWDGVSFTTYFRCRKIERTVKQLASLLKTERKRNRVVYVWQKNGTM